jgi:hypothetical protein
MNKFRFTLNVLAIAIFTFAFASLAQAQATRTWVSGVGDDANPCSRTAPCKTFAGSISKTAVNGEINCLDPGGFGAVTITKSITIDCHEVFAGIANSGTTGISIPFDSFSDANKTVRLRNLNINGANTGLRGIRVSGTVNASSSEVIIEDCLVNGQAGNGIEDVRGNATGALLAIHNTTIRDVTGAGVLIKPSTGSVQINASMSHMRIHDCAGAGINAGNNARVSVNASTISGNNTGVFVDNTAGGTTEVHLDQCQVSVNGTGVNASTANSNIYVSNTTLMNNGTLANAAGGGQVLTYGNNLTGGAPFGTGILQR